MKASGGDKINQDTTIPRSAGKQTSKCPPNAKGSDGGSGGGGITKDIVNYANKGPVTKGNDMRRNEDAQGAGCSWWMEKTKPA